MRSLRERIGLPERGALAMPRDRQVVIPIVPVPSAGLLGEDLLGMRPVTVTRRESDPPQVWRAPRAHAYVAYAELTAAQMQRTKVRKRKK